MQTYVTATTNKNNILEQRACNNTMFNNLQHDINLVLLVS